MGPAMIALALLAPLALASPAVSTTPAATDPSAALSVGKESIGESGATIQLSRRWKREELNPDLGPDQFLKGIGSSQLALTALEIPGLFVEEHDARIMAELARDNVGLSLGKDAEPGKVSVVKKGSTHVARTRIRGKAVGREVEFQFAVVARPGLAYQFMGWSSGRAADKLEAELDDIIESLDFPSERSDWGRGMTPRTFRRTSGDVKLAATVRPSVLTDATEELGGALSLASPDQRFAVVLDVMLWFGSNKDLLDSHKEEFQSTWKSSTELRRSGCTVGGIDGLRAAFLNSDGGEPVFLETFALPLDDDRVLEIRMASNGEDDAHRELRDAVLASIEISTLGDVDAFPVSEDGESWFTGTGWRPAVLEEALAGATTVLSLSSYQPCFVEWHGKDLILQHGDRILRLPRGTGEPELIYAGYETNWNTYRRLAKTATLEGATYVVEKDALVRLREGTKEVLDVECQAVAALEDGRLLLVRARPAVSPLGSADDSLERAELFVRDRSGVEKALRLGSLGFYPQVVTSGNRSLIASDNLHPELGSRLQVVDVDRPDASVDLGEWSDVRWVHPARPGWLVLGTPPRGATGWWHVLEDGGLSFVFGGAQLSLSTISGGTLYFQDNGAGKPRESALRSVDLDVVREMGKSLTPWSTADLVELAASSLAGLDLPLASEAELQAALDRADAASVEAFGVPLPTEPKSVDLLVDTNATSWRLGARGQELLAALVTRSLLDAGAQWVPPAEEAVGVDVNIFQLDGITALASHPVGAVMQSAFEESSWTSPVTTILDQAEGRTLLVGNDIRSLRDAFRDASAALEELDIRKARLAQIEALLTEYPKNAALRGHVYSELNAAGREALVSAICRQYVGTEDASEHDLLASMLLRVGKKESPDALVRDLRNAIARFPDANAFYLLLGETYERRGSAEDLEKARACFARVSENAFLGPLNERAEAGLARVDEGEGR